MSEDKVYMLPNVITPNKPVIFDEKVCDGCNRCVEVCPTDVLFPNPERGKPPIILYPDECWHCDVCVRDCPLADKGAIEISWPLMASIRWKRKGTGEHFRLGMPRPR